MHSQSEVRWFRDIRIAPNNGHHAGARPISFSLVGDAINHFEAGRPVQRDAEHVVEMQMSKLPKLFLTAFAKCQTAIALVCFGFGVQLANAQASHVPAVVTVCAPCHGSDGAGGDVEKPNLAGQKSIYIRRQLEAFRAGRRKHPKMRSIVRDLTDREIDQIVIYYSTLAPR